MANFSYRYESPDRFVAGTVGQPGERTFFLQVREGSRLTSVACEKQQVQVLADHLEKVVSLVTASDDLPRGHSDNDPLDVPITEDFRVGTMTIAWDPQASRIVIEMFSVTDVVETDDADEAELLEATTSSAEEVLVVQIEPSRAREFIDRARALVAAGRTACPFCNQPLDPGGHICPRANGYRKPLF
ncbi:DUF3090 family protein [Parenemella sanctibonifatiensis]|uniref:DUF3090 domain-containing protein n=1 Tax=Parenemella sanctibonifatiensis TaxID=2016505 RepID=A0A255EEJ8_9ACTN|nr:DUF3090 family protein [Parenemella sanctibonifatiensis]OYN89978.1 hypothetical protein CGZ92_01680 [Parenemella sanctibonifatiensis]